MLNKENKNIFKSFFHVGVGTILGLVISVLTTPIITRLVDPEEYGKLSIFNLYISIAVMTLCLGLDQSLLRYYYKKDDIQYKRELFTKCFFVPFIILLLVCLIFYFINLSFGSFFEFSGIIFVFLIGVVFEFAFRFSTLLLRLENKSLLYSLTGIINRIIYVGVAILLLKLLDVSSFDYLAYSLVLGLIGSSVFAILINKKIWKPLIKTKECEINFKELMRYGLPFILVSGLETLFSSIDKLSLKILCDYSTVGIYASALSIAHLFAIVQSSFNTVWAPVSIKHYEENPEDNAFYTKYNQAITLIMFAFGLTLIASKDLLVLMLGEKYRSAVFILPFLCFHPIMYTISETTFVGIVISKKSYLQLITVAVSCLVNICGNILLVPHLGGKGAAISTGFSYIVFYTLRTIFGKKNYYFDNHPLKFVAATILLIVFSAISTFLSFQWWMILIYLFMIGILIVLYWETFKKMLYLVYGLASKLFKKKGENVS